MPGFEFSVCRPVFIEDHKNLSKVKIKKNKKTFSFHSEPTAFSVVSFSFRVVLLIWGEHFTSVIIEGL